MNPHRADTTLGTTEPPAGRAAPPTLYRLIARSGPCEGQSLEVKTKKFFIGRDASCHLRPAAPEVADIHAEIELVDGMTLYLRDMDAPGGTLINGVPLYNRRKEVFDGDEIRIGPLVLTLRAGSHWDQPGLTEAPDGWPLASPDAPPETPAPARKAAPAQASAYPVGERRGAKGSLTSEVVGDVLKITLLTPEYNDEDTVSPLRIDLQSLLNEELPRREVVDMGNVTYVSSRAVGVLLAHFQGLGRVDGALRVCAVHPTKVMPVLNQMKLGLFIDVYDTVEEALQDPWE